MTYQHLHFTSLDGRSLRDGSLVTTANQFTDESAPFDVDQLTLNIDASVATLYGNIGVTDRMEIGFAAPFVALAARRVARQHLPGPRVHFRRPRARARPAVADSSCARNTMCSTRTASGIAAAADVRLPTGRREDLLGSGATSVKFSGIGSLENGRTPRMRTPGSPSRTRDRDQLRRCRGVYRHGARLVDR